MTNKLPTVNFIGNKEKIANWICGKFPKGNMVVLDAFSGGCSISYTAKLMGYSVISNDVLTINNYLAKALIENNQEQLSEKDVEIIFSGTPKKKFVYENYSNVYFYPDECMQLDQYRDNIEELSNEYKKSIAFSLMRRAMIRKRPYSRFNVIWEKVVQLRDEEFSYKHYKRRRAYHNNTFKQHFIDNLDSYNKAVFDNGKFNKSLNQDVFEVIDKVKADIIYIDPPYPGTMNNYYGFYGFLDEYIKGEKLEPFRNDFRDKQYVISQFEKLFSKMSDFKYWYISYNNSSYPNKEMMLDILSKYTKRVDVVEKKHNYQISGKIYKNNNKEYLFMAQT